MRKSCNKQKIIRVALLMLLDIAMSFLAGFLSLLIRLDFSFDRLMSSGYFSVFLRWAPVFAAALICVFFPLKLYNSLWEFASVDELLHILVAVFILNGLLFITVALDWIPLPLSFPALNALILSLLTIITRFSYRMLRSNQFIPVHGLSRSWRGWSRHRWRC